MKSLNAYTNMNLAALGLGIDVPDSSQHTIALPTSAVLKVPMQDIHASSRQGNTQWSIRVETRAMAQTCMRIMLYAYLDRFLGACGRITRGGDLCPSPPFRRRLTWRITNHLHG